MQLLAQQQAYFYNTQAYASAISPLAPQQGARFPAVPSPAPYTYAPPPVQPSFAPQMAGVAGALPSIMATAASTTGFLGSMLLPGRMGTAVGVLDPFSSVFSAGMAGFRAGGVMGGLGAGALAAAPYAALGAAFSYGAQNFYQGMQNFGIMAGQVPRVMGSALTEHAYGGGRGFDARGIQQITQTTQQLALLPELRTSIGELSSVMDRLSREDAFFGVHNVEQFQQRFKDSIRTLRQISRVMGTTMEEALPLFAESRRSGFFTAQDIVANAVARRSAGALLGATSEQVGQVQRVGADLMTMLGGTRRQTGAIAATQQFGMIGAAYKAGILSEEDMGNITGGATGVQGAQIMTQQMLQLSASMARTSMGRILTAAAAERDPETGKLTGRINSRVASEIASGRYSVSEVRDMAQRNIGGDRAGFALKEPELTANFTAQGPEAVVSSIRMLMEQSGRFGKDAEQYVGHLLRRYGVSNASLRDFLLRLTRDMDKVRDRMTDDVRRAEAGIEMDNIRRERSLSSQWDLLKRQVGEAVGGPFQEAGASVAGWVAHSLAGACNLKLCDTRTTPCPFGRDSSVVMSVLLS